MLFQIFRIKDRSMLPTVGSGDYVLVSKLSYSISKLGAGDLIVSRHPSRRMYIIKRIERVLPSGYYLVGDNRGSSEDSRTFGAVKRELIVGKVVMVIRKKGRATYRRTW